MTTSQLSNYAVCLREGSTFLADCLSNIAEDEDATLLGSLLDILTSATPHA